MNNGVFATNGLVYGNSFSSSSPSPPSPIMFIPISVVASSQDSGPETQKAADGDFATRWSAR
jgi:hypothetical protein